MNVDGIAIGGVSVGRELLGYRLATIHNLTVMNRLMREIRQGISDKKLKEVKAKWLG